MNDRSEAPQEARAAEEALRESEERFRTIVENSIDLIALLDATGRFVYVSPAYERILGYRPEDLVGTDAFELVHPDDREEGTQRFAETFTGSLASMPEIRLRHADGRYLVIQGAARAILGADGEAKMAVGFGHDITKQCESDERHRELVEGIDAIVWEADPQSFRFTFVSPRAVAFLGYSVEEWLQPDFWVDHLHPEDRDETVRTCRAAVADAVDHELEYRMVAVDGRAVWFSDYVRVIVDDAGAPVRLRGVMFDIGERKVAEEERARLEDELRQTQKMEAIGRLAGGVAHDFNNLLTAITGYAALARADSTDDRVTSCIDEIERAAGRAAGLTRQLLAFSRHQPMVAQILDLNTIVLEMDEMLRRIIGEDVELVIDLAPHLHRIEADATQVQQVLLNLCVNARDAMPGGGRLSIETRNVDGDGGACAALVVSDTGTGMAGDTMERIFEPFFTTKDVGRGTGLGLAAVHGIVEQVGGRVHVESELDGGSRFEVLFPAAADGRVAEAPPPASSPSTTGTETILLVEDEPSVREIARRFLEAKGYAVIEAGNAAEAAERFREQRVDLLLTDAVMPERSGPELYAELALERPGLPVVYMSGYAPDLAGETRAVGTAEYVAKPFAPDELAGAVRRVLDAV